MRVAAFVILALLPLTVPVALANIVLFGIGAAIAGEAFYKLWSKSCFPRCCEEQRKV